ncbi:TcpQ domain-containing protein [Proteus columbae]|uniref:TcpQ domain-containing protein n=1 Tax=Proteus columbae TaxID=1987580 RepID=UPI00288995D0|nr:TcpQ domain-containing protein [Proteus columbae]
MTLSSFSLAASNMENPTTVSDLSRSPFKADREKAQKLAEATTAPETDKYETTVKPSISPMVVVPSIKPVDATVSALKLEEKQLLSSGIGVWAQAQGLRLFWNSNRDYLIYSTINITGKNRDEVLSQLGELFRSENYGLVVKLYEKNNVLVIDGQ